MASFFGGTSSSSANMINIRRDVQDPYYRYKMPRLQSKIEGKGNGIKTVVPNLVEIGKSLARPPSYITKFFGAELGALSTCDEKAAKYIVNGAHDAEKLQCLLDVFIAKFVLCPSCENPETILSASKKDGTIYRSCQACGNKSTVDMLHKLVTFIRANPPPKAPRKTQAKDRAEDASGMVAASGSDGARGASHPSAMMRSSPLGRDDGSFESEGGASDGIITGMVVPDNFDGSLASVSVSREDEDDWAEDAAAEQRRQELESLSESVKSKLSLTATGEAAARSNGTAALDSLLEPFADYLEANAAAISVDAVCAYVEEKGIPTDKAVVVVVQVLFGGEGATREALQRSLADEKYIELLKRIVDSTEDEDDGRSPSREKTCLALLGSFERVVGVISPALSPAIPLILQTLYNEDVVDEDVLGLWREKASKRFVPKDVGASLRRLAEPFFKWLSEASSEDEEDEEDA